MKEEAETGQVDALDCELAVYRKGCITVHIDLNQGYLTLRESRQWCNNFTRTITADQVAAVRKWLEQSELAIQVLNEADVGGEGEATICQQCTDGQTTLTPDAESRVVWLVTLTVDSQKKTRTGLLPFPAGWRDLQRLIERLSRVPFRLI